jgi:hypothetical protein
LRKQGKAERGIVWGSFVDRILHQQFVQLALRGVWPPKRLEIVLDLLIRGGVERVDQREQCALILHVSHEDWDLGHLTGAREIVWALREERPSRAQSVRSGETLISDKIC